MRLLKQSEDKHEKDMKALTDAFIQSQTNMANILKEILQAKSATPVQAELPAQSDVVKVAASEQEKNAPQEDKKELENIKEEKIEEGPKLFGLTKKLFGSKKEKKYEYHEDDIQEEGPRLGDATPVSLDDIEDAPVVLDEEQIIAPIKNVQQKKETIKEEKPIENVPQNDENTDSSDDWEWEYVDEDDGSDDGDWEYIEVPEDEAESVSAPAPTSAKTTEVKPAIELVAKQKPEPKEAPKHDINIKPQEKVQEQTSPVQEIVQEVATQIQKPFAQEQMAEEVQAYDNQAYDENMLYDGQEQYYDPNVYAQNYELPEGYNPQSDAYLTQGDYETTDNVDFGRFMKAMPAEGYDDDLMDMQTLTDETSK